MVSGEPCFTLPYWDYTNPIRQALPAELFSRRGPERLHVITCGGEYLPDAGGYQQNLVVTAAPA